MVDKSENADCRATAPLLEVENLQVAFKGRSGEALAVRGATFSLDAGETVALVGESGCGKSVTAKAVMGLVRGGRVLPGSRVRFGGADVLGFSRREWDSFRGREASMVFQDALACLNPTMRVGAQLTEALRNHCPHMSRRERLARAEELLVQTGVPDAHGCLRRYPHELSGGMRQRVMIASAMAARPRLLIADEPTTSLDVTVQAQTLQLMGRMQAQTGCAVLLVTHDMGLVAEFASRVLVMYAGKIVEQGACDEVFARPAHPYTRALLAAVPRLDAPPKQGFRAIEGTPPDPARMPVGCAFAPRCPQAMRVCAQLEPQDYEVGGADGGVAPAPGGGPACAPGADEAGAGGGPARRAACWLCDARCPQAACATADDDAGADVEDAPASAAGHAVPGAAPDAPMPHDDPKEAC